MPLKKGLRFLLRINTSITDFSVIIILTIQQNDGQIQMLKQNLSRGEMVLLPQPQLLKQRGGSLYSTAEKVAQSKDYF